MPGFMRGIHVFRPSQISKTWIAGTSPSMTLWQTLLWNGTIECAPGPVVCYNHRMQNGVSSSFITASDGLRLHARCYGNRTASATPVVCLPGLARTAADFAALASALSYEKPFRRVIALDYRGRGQSQYDRNPANYALPV